METVFYYFLKRTLDDSRQEAYPTDKFLGEVGDYVEIDGIGYIIEDYTIEKYNWFELTAGGAY